MNTIWILSLLVTIQLLCLQPQQQMSLCLNKKKYAKA